MSNSFNGDAGIVTTTEFPHGLRCMECAELLVPGTAYATKPGPVPFDPSVSVIVCVACSLGLR